MAGPSPILIAAILAVAALCCIGRLYRLMLVSNYPALLSFFVLQLIEAFASNTLNRSANGYAFLFVGMTALEWIVYSLMLKEIYNAIFSSYPGIAVFGRCSIYVTAATTACLGVATLIIGRDMQGSNRLLLNRLESVSHVVLIGFVTLIPIMLFAISRYPLRVHKNVFVNLILFSAILLAEALALIVDLSTKHGYTSALNLAAGAAVFICLASWPFLLSREGQTKIIRPNMSGDDERRLMKQLNEINSFLLEFARNKHFFRRYPLHY